MIKTEMCCFLFHTYYEINLLIYLSSFDKEHCKKYTNNVIVISFRILQPLNMEKNTKVSGSK